MTGAADLALRVGRGASWMASPPRASRASCSLPARDPRRWRWPRCAIPQSQRTWSSTSAQPPFSRWVSPSPKACRRASSPRPDPRSRTGCLRRRGGHGTRPAGSALRRPPARAARLRREPDDGPDPALRQPCPRLPSASATGQLIPIGSPPWPARCVAASLGPLPGPIHVNVPLREPLVPSASEPPPRRAAAARRARRDVASRSRKPRRSPANHRDRARCHRLRFRQSRRHVPP